MSNQKRARQPAPPREVVIELTVEDIRCLLRVAHYYERSMGPTRHLVRLTGNREVKQKFAFVREESDWLERFARDELARAQEEGREPVAVAFTPRTLVAFWGRLLAGLHSARSRRKLSTGEIARREEMAVRLCRGAQILSPAVLERELATRRTSELAWMRAALHGEGEPTEADSGPSSRTDHVGA